jgi:hypothetical protein
VTKDLAGVVQNETMTDAPQRREPRWPAILALLAVGGLRLALPESLSAGPRWLLIAVVGFLLIPTIWAYRSGLDNLNRVSRASTRCWNIIQRMRNLLIERFKLAVHSEKKEVAGYQLVVAKGGPKLVASPGDPNQMTIRQNRLPRSR